MKLLRALCAASLIFMASSVFAAKGGMKGVVKLPTVLVYQAPDFDSQVIARVHRGKQVRVSKATTKTPFKFRKIAIGKTVGYISDTDVVVEGGRQPASEQKRRHKETKPVYFGSFVGVLVGALDFKESISGVDAQDILLIYGVKLTGPDVIFNGPVVDFNLTFHSGAPKYYGPLSTGSPGGFVLLADALWLLPIHQRMNFTGLFGIGPLLSYTSFQVVNANRAQSLDQMDVGLSTMLGLVVRVGSVGLRLEGKYMLAKESYKLLQAAVQTEW